MDDLNPSTALLNAGASETAAPGIPLTAITPTEWRLCGSTASALTSTAWCNVTGRTGYTRLREELRRQSDSARRRAQRFQTCAAEITAQFPDEPAPIILKGGIAQLLPGGVAALNPRTSTCWQRIRTNWPRSWGVPGKFRIAARRTDESSATWSGMTTDLTLTWRSPFPAPAGDGPSRARRRHAARSMPRRCNATCPTMPATPSRGHSAPPAESSEEAVSPPGSAPGSRAGRTPGWTGSPLY
jgi:hypothetical protein